MNVNSISELTNQSTSNRRNLLCFLQQSTSTSWKLSDRLPFLFGKACYVFRSENALYGTGHIMGRMMIMKTALLLNTL